jgi:hypothetical protein
MYMAAAKLSALTFGTFFTESSLRKINLIDIQGCQIFFGTTYHDG